MTEKQKSFFKIESNRIALLDLDLDNGTFQQMFPNINFKNRPTYWVTRLSVPKPLRNKKIATDLITEMVNWLDKNKYNAIIGVNPYGDLNLTQLINFYSKFGFNINDQNVGYRLNRI